MRFLFLTAVLLVAACESDTQSQRCKDVCTRDAECALTAPDVEKGFDKGECVRSCSALEGEEWARSKVEAHSTCVLAAANCERVRRCH